MKSATERKSLKEVLEMSGQSLNPDEYEQFQIIHDSLMLRRSIPGDVLLNYKMDDNVSCTTCKAYSSAWIYCPILKQMLIIDGFDETGELHGCNAHNESGLFWTCKYCGENKKPKCHKCVREDGESVSDELQNY